MQFNGKSGSDRGKPISIRRVAGGVVVVLAAVGIGMVIRGFRLRLAGEGDVVQAPRAVERVEVAEVQYIEEPLAIEEVFVEPEAVEDEPESAATSIVDADVQSDAGVEEVPAFEPVEEDSRSKERRARAALALIGYDREADEVFVELINDPSVSSNDRHDLIEDLNQEGFSDPKNTTLDDLPVIEYRIEFIEYHLPYAMDKVNSDAFKEAHKDLVNMANRLTGR